MLWRVESESTQVDLRLFIVPDSRHMRHGFLLLKLILTLT